MEFLLPDDERLQGRRMELFEEQRVFFISLIEQFIPIVTGSLLLHFGVRTCLRL
ncbi:MAG: hypothetical protein AAB728_02175 [Patescibacteria group bacterium]